MSLSSPLKDDPRIGRDLRAAFADEAAHYDTTDLAPIKTRVLTAIGQDRGGLPRQAGTIGASNAILIAGTSAVLAALGVNALFEGQASPASIDSIVQPATSTQVPPAPSPNPPEPEIPRPSVAKPRAPSSKPMSTPRPNVATSSLSEQLALYERGVAELRAHRVAGAIGIFESYLLRFPTGELASEAGLSLLEARIAQDNHTKVEELTRSLSARQDLLSRRPELLRVRGEALIRLGRCREAQSVLLEAGSLDPESVSSRTIAQALSKCDGGPDFQ